MSWHCACLCRCVRIVSFAVFVVVLVSNVSAQSGASSGAAAAPFATSSDSPPQSPPATTALTQITVDQALAIAEQNSPLLREGQAVIDAGQARIQTARAYTNPTVEFLAGHQKALAVPLPGPPGTLQHYSVVQPIEVPAERRLRIHAATLGLVADRHLAAGVRLAVMANVKRAFYDVIRRKEQLSNAKSNLDLVQDLRRRVEVEVNVGEKGRLELTRAEAELSRARAVVTSAEIELAAARASLKAATGMPSAETPDPVGVLDQQVQLAPLNNLRQQLLADHPALSEAQSRAAQAHTVVADERARRVPQPSLYGEYEHQPDLSFYRLGVSVSIPLWDRRSGKIHEAEAEANRSEAVRRQRELELTAALERAYDQYQISKEQVVSLQAGSLREAEAAVDAAQAAYRFGERGIVEVLDAQRVLQGVRTDLLDALYARQTALIDLEELGVIHP